jgi:hypothetical protein
MNLTTPSASSVEVSTNQRSAPTNPIVMSSVHDGRNLIVSSFAHKHSTDWILVHPVRMKEARCTSHSIAVLQRGLFVLGCKKMLYISQRVVGAIGGVLMTLCKMRV